MNGMIQDKTITIYVDAQMLYGLRIWPQQTYQINNL